MQLSSYDPSTATQQPGSVGSSTYVQAQSVSSNVWIQWQLARRVQDVSESSTLHRVVVRSESPAQHPGGIVGSAVGEVVGESVVGSSVGDSVGFAVGLTVGHNVGILVGELLGASDVHSIVQLKVPDVI